MTVQPLPHIAALAAYGYVPVDIAPGKKLVPLALNESAFPPSPTVPRAIADAADKFNVPTVKVTGGQRIDLLGVSGEDLPPSG